MTHPDHHLADLPGLVSSLTLEEKVSLLSGRDAWSTQPMEKIGLAPMGLSDGPSGVRGTILDERVPSLNLPSATALSSSWDVGLAETYGAVAAGEARSKGVHVILGPTINLHRSPLGGRHFEAYSEDPTLTAHLAAAYVDGVQALGVAATPKHYVANDFETQRFTADVVVSERALRELYLLAFEKAVVESHAWLVMSAYNSINGTTATEHDLLSRPLKDEWGFDGVVVSDWTAVRTIESARQPQDLAMPGPGGAWGPALVEAVRRGEVSEEVLDRKVLRILRLAARVGALAGHESHLPASDLDGVAFARRAAAEGMVLVRNEGMLPIDPSSLSKVAVLGENARFARTQGGGSAEVVPGPIISPLDGLREALAGVAVEYGLGATVQSRFAPLNPAAMTNPVTGRRGAHVRYLDAGGRELLVEERFASAITNFGGEAAIPGCAVVEIATTFTPDVTAPVKLGFAYPGRGRLRVNGELLLDETIPGVGPEQIDAYFDPEWRTVDVPATENQPIELLLEYEPGEEIDGMYGSLSVILGMEPIAWDPEELIGDAVRVAAEADMAVVVVGTNAQVECEGFDRSSLQLPGRQDDLVAAVAAVNPRTVVVVNSGAPVEMPWRDDVAAVVLAWFPGQEFGSALADVLLGAAEPGGRLPTTWPRTLADAPVVNVTPVEGKVRYDEGIHVGYKAWLKAGREPAYAFGFGLGYTSWQLGEPEAESEVGPDGLDVALDVTNTGRRAGKQVVQVYARRPNSAVDRPLLWLVGFAVVRLEAGARDRVRISVPRRAFAHWDDGWTYEPGDFELLVGCSSDSLGAPLTVRMAPAVVGT